MTTRDELLKEIDAYLEATGWSESYLGVVAMRDSGFVFRIRAGRNVRLDTADRIRKYMRTHKPAKKSKRRSANQNKTLTLATAS